MTVTDLMAMQPVAGVKVMGAIPADTPVTMPVVAPTVPMAVAPELHAPMPGAVSVILAATQTPDGPLMAGAALMVIVRITKQPGSELVEPIE